MKVLWLIAIALVLWRLLAGRWPWQSRAQLHRHARIAQARCLLEVGPRAGRQEIIDAHRRRIAAIHPDRGGSNEAVHQINAARDILLAELAQSRPEQS
ncbi:MAG: molecular chaperone DnaJ [Novosphingobium sp.]|nr:molecular chaperone DnaJ [Novosphingobium sp.]